MSAMAQGDEVKRVAVLKVVDESESVTPGVKLNLRQTLTVAINELEGYEAYTRVNLSAIKDEHAFERSGYVSDDEIKELGRMNSVDYVLVAEVAPYGEGFITLAASLYEVVKGRIFKASEAEITSIEREEMKSLCRNVAHTLLKGRRQSGSSGIGGGTGSQSGAQSITIQVPGTNVSFEMVKVEAGSFIMGCTSEQGGDCDGDESPYHRVTISQDYYIGKFEVTQELYEAVMRVNPSNWKSFDRPVEMVSWNDAQEFCAELSRLTGRRFSLPTEAEWEYAARGGKKSTNAKYSGSSSVAAVAWYDGNSGGQTHPVGKLRANELGIHDMSGNVWEWCYDWYGNYSSTSQTDPVGPGSGSGRVLCGGSWNGHAEYCRVANRSSSTSGGRYCHGFRVVLH